jgi:hypothetical protein
MKKDNLTLFEKAQEMRAKDPKMSVEAACRSVKMTSSAYYYWRVKKTAKKKPAVVKTSYQRIDAPTQSKDVRMLAVFGSAAEILSFANEALK